ncbi:hypothetical protein [Streptomyces sp. NBC_01500]|uniref:hypothetical protein n=1 Tax=Streptomyces sp. NBC_01500 TaxID=2903886 RepID=UPI002253FC11|nr:hypothetical protein [Streptomyces sp. NBC_01500]MCX4554231.1 hypothetical protein [Streptomyces sp. NBC_01500]
MNTTHQQHRRHRVYAVLGTCAALALTGCSGTSHTGSDAAPSRRASGPAASASASPSETASTDPDAQAKAAVLEVYGNYWHEVTVAYAKASVSGTDLNTYAVGTARLQAQQETASLKEDSLVMTGRPVSKVTDTKVDTSRKVPQATIQDCLDVTHWTMVKRTTRKAVPLPKERLKRYISVATAEIWNGKWVIVKTTPQARAC